MQRGAAHRPGRATRPGRRTGRRQGGRIRQLQQPLVHAASLRGRTEPNSSASTATGNANKLRAHPCVRLRQLAPASLCINTPLPEPTPAAMLKAPCTMLTNTQSHSRSQHLRKLRLQRRYGLLKCAPGPLCIVGVHQRVQLPHKGVVGICCALLDGRCNWRSRVVRRHGAGGLGPASCMQQ